MKLRIATRGSPLALWQAHHIKSLLTDGQSLASVLTDGQSVTEVELLVLKTTGDRITDRPLSEVGGKGLFVKEIEEALLDGRADLAVHSLKDVPAELPAGLGLVAIPERADPRDAVVLPHGRTIASLDELPPNAHVGTSSLRRVCQLIKRRPDIRTSAVRGNVDTRLRKLDEGQYDAIILASAGLDRLGLGARIALRIPPDQMLPAVGQAALAIECRLDDARTLRVVKQLDHATSAMCITAERAFLRGLEGGCQTPIAAHATLADGTLQLIGWVSRTDGSAELRAEGSTTDLQAPAALGTALADALLAQGAAGFLRPA